MRLVNKVIIGITVLTIPILAISTDAQCDGTTYEINTCLKHKMLNLDVQLKATKNNNVKIFKIQRDDICKNISTPYKTGTYESIKYGNCIISLDNWYLDQIKK